MVWGKQRVPPQVPHDLRPPGVARGHPATAPLPPDGGEARTVELGPTPAASPRLSGKALPALGWSLRSAGRGSCLEPAAAGRAVNAAPSQISSAPSNTRTQSKERPETSEELVSWQPVGRRCLSPELRGPSRLTRPATSLGCCGNAYIFPKRKTRQDEPSSQAEYNQGTETSASLLYLFYATCFWKSLSYLSNNKIKLSRTCNEQIIWLIKDLHLSLKAWNILAWHPATGNENK